MNRYLRDHSFTNLLPSGEIKETESENPIFDMKQKKAV